MNATNLEMRMRNCWRKSKKLRSWKHHWKMIYSGILWWARSSIRWRCNL